MKKTLTVLAIALALTSCQAVKKIGSNIDSNYVQRNAGPEAKTAAQTNQLTIK